jgi:hypothetical protein
MRIPKSANRIIYDENIANNYIRIRIFTPNENAVTQIL